MPKEQDIYQHDRNDHYRSEDNAVRNFSHALGVALSNHLSNEVTLADPVSCLRIMANSTTAPKTLARVWNENHPNLDTKAPSWETR